MKNNIYPIAHPYFSKKEITIILNKYKKILEGNGLMTMGPYVKKFEEKFSKFLNCKYSIATSSCTSALEIAIHALRLKKNDEVIIPSQTFIATASSVLRNNLKLKICDVNEKFQMDFDALKKTVSKKTKAVILVHYGGHIDKNIFQIKNFLKKKKIKIIEDCAHAIGAKRKGVYAGNIGDIGCFSFYSTKNLTTGEGGMIVSNNVKFFNIMRAYRSRGLNYKSNFEAYSELGTNSRMTEFQAILGIEQMKRIIEITNKRNQIAKNYNGILFNKLKLSKIKQFFDDESGNNVNSYWKFPVKLVQKIDRQKLKKKMRIKKVSIDWAYDPLVHKQKVISKKIGNISLKNSEKYSKNFFCLPMYLSLKYKDQKYICEKLKESLDE